VIVYDPAGVNLVQPTRQWDEKNDSQFTATVTVVDPEIDDEEVSVPTTVSV
jgi:hypothetical protein